MEIKVNDFYLEIDKENEDNNKILYEVLNTTKDRVYFRDSNELFLSIDLNTLKNLILQNIVKKI